MVLAIHSHASFLAFFFSYSFRIDWTLPPVPLFSCNYWGITCLSIGPLLLLVRLLASKLLWAWLFSILASLPITTSSLLAYNLASFAVFVCLTASKVTVACAFTSSLTFVQSWQFPLSSANVVSCNLALPHFIFTDDTLLYCHHLLHDSRKDLY